MRREDVSSAALLQLLQDHLRDPVDIRQNIVVPKADNPPSMVYEIVGAALIADIVIMLSTIRFDDETVLTTGEIGNERADWKLAVKFIPSQLPTTQNRP